MGGVTAFLAIFIYSKWMRVGDYCSDDLQKKMKQTKCSIVCNTVTPMLQDALQGGEKQTS